jgi:fructan beta-fructosidase
MTRPSTTHSLCALLAVAGLAQASQQGDILIADFEGRDYGAWKTTGEAFGPGPARGTLPNQMEVSGYEGKGLVNSFYKGDGTTGTLTSPPVKIQRKFINFLIGGGMHPGKTCINLLVDGKVVRTATGPNDRPGGSERLDWHSWDVSDLIGRQAVIQIVDQETGGWGHLNVDQIVQSNRRRQQEIVTAPLYHETYRPQFHFTPARNWTNDPNGLVYYEGEYHLFFQHNPKGINWGNMTWGHAVSRDLVHWEQLANAIEPDRLGTIFSGSAVVDWNDTAGFGKPIVAIYTSAGGTSPESKGQPFSQSIAYSLDRGRTWAKYEKNPVLPHIIGENRDPKVVWHGPTRQWIMTLFKDGNVYGFFASPDLKRWTHLHDITVPGCGECPDFFEMPVDGEPDTKKWVWTAANGHYLVGTFDGKRFAPESGPHQADWGANYYAVQTFSDIPASDGRRIQIAWMNGGKYPGMPFNQQMSFPCELKLRRLPGGLRICRLPVQQIELLHGKEHSWSGRVVQPGEDLLAGIQGELFDIGAEIDVGPAEAGRLGRSLSAQPTDSSAGRAGTTISLLLRGEPVTYTVADKKLTCLGRSAALAPLDGRIKLQILLDRTSIEVFGQDGCVSMTSCFLPRADAKSLALQTTGGPVKIISLKVCELRSAWKAR